MTEGRRMTGIIDVHAHAMLPSWVDALKAAHPQGKAIIEGLPVPSWSPEAAIESMDAHGIDAMVLSNPIGTKGFEGVQAVTLARRMNDELADAVSNHPKRFGAFAVLPLTDMDATLLEVDRALGPLGLDGVCLQTNSNGRYPGEPYFEPLIAELNKRKTVAFVHPCGPAFMDSVTLPFNPALLEFMFDSTRAVASLVYSGTRKRYPDFTYIATHGGGTIPYLTGRLTKSDPLRMGGFGVPLTQQEIREGLQSLVYDLTASTGEETLAALVELVPASRIVMGFDYPMRARERIAPHIRDVEQSRFISDADFGRIARTNALSFLPRLAEHHG